MSHEQQIKDLQRYCTSREDQDAPPRSKPPQEVAMGFNTTVVVMNDAIGAIKDDPDFGRKLYEAVVGNQFPADIAATNGRMVHCNAATVIETHHADYSVLVRVGRNSGEIVREPPERTAIAAYLRARAHSDGEIYLSMHDIDLLKILAAEVERDGT